MTGGRPSREECFAAAGAALAAAIERRDALSPRQAAQAAWRPGGPSVDEIERRITARRLSEGWQ
ncbi:hypothetical protein [Blastococcus sp. TF02A-35]|uniref:hypothetical protein n=1 Tax=Blastococcus sp. TF02A-35 TaxID=2559612 RepID=UPI00107430C5|nr:hypothetical protein [Blastococcus sp. TF02A_35]TFV49547.1 hypothetical protein E4P43_11910 [Blastococcus sp. TF02A_35]